MINIRNFKIYYFMVATVNGIFGMAMPLYYESVLGFDPMKVSLLIAMPSIVMLLQPVWGVIVDKYQRPREIAIMGLIISSLMLTLLMFTTNYVTVLLCIFLYSLFRAPVWSTVDNMIITYCINRKFNYGALRVFASIAWGSSLLIFYPCILIWGYNSYFVLSLFTSLILSVLIMKFPKEIRLESKRENEEEFEFFVSLKTLLKSKDFYYIIFFTLFFSAMFVTNLNYLTMYLSDLGVKSIMIAIIIFLSVAPEFIILPRIEKYENKFDAVTWMIIVCILYAIRYVITASTHSVFVIAIVSMIHGIAMSIYIPIFLKHLKNTVPNNVSTTALTINSLMAAISGIIMSFFAGVVTMKYGLNNVFYLNVLAMCLAIIVLVLYKKHRAKIFFNKSKI